MRLYFFLVWRDTSLTSARKYLGWEQKVWRVWFYDVILEALYFQGLFLVSYVQTFYHLVSISCLPGRFSVGLGFVRWDGFAVWVVGLGFVLFLKLNNTKKWALFDNSSWVLLSLTISKPVKYQLNIKPVVYLFWFCNVIYPKLNCTHLFFEICAKYHHKFLYYIAGCEDSVPGGFVQGFRREFSFTVENVITGLWQRECVIGY